MRNKRNGRYGSCPEPKTRHWILTVSSISRQLGETGSLASQGRRRTEDRQPLGLAADFCSTSLTESTFDECALEACYRGVSRGFGRTLASGARVTRANRARSDKNPYQVGPRPTTLLRTPHGVNGGIRCHVWIVPRAQHARRAERSRVLVELVRSTIRADLSCVS
jgi:hypothetical protein